MARAIKTRQQIINESFASRQKPPVPIYSEGQVKKMESEQGMFRLPIVWMENKDTGHKLKVTAKDSIRRLELSNKGYATIDGAQPTTGEKIEIESPEFKRLKFEKLVNGLHKKDLIEMAQKMGIEPEGTVSDLRDAILGFGQDENKDNDEG